ncbi:family 78 glycoside hydrolase catalytic domain [Streptomyces sp. 5-10]|uniref:family 78 glycoside hydrolase catalytic domain n=1 Tax=Streptomyces sp. 5-10 TaxID=878925 RepID=UPI00168AC597|nr:family 78 glycoside hydrolase catalytic domain [Streptomyces sp. 5-10]MBD3003404.1 family 78 glycoside hydrolase catalytic domain [Streptomyces sp. 5-10]
MRDSVTSTTGLARGAAVTASESNTVRKTWEPALAVDGLTNSALQTAAGYSSGAHPGADVSGEPITLTLDLKTAKTFDELALYPTRGGGSETWHPRFGYHGFRYLELKGVPDSATVTVRGEVLRTDNTSAGDFTSSDALINDIHSLRGTDGAFTLRHVSHLAFRPTRQFGPCRTWVITVMAMGISLPRWGSLDRSWGTNAGSRLGAGHYFRHKLKYR